MADSGGCSQSVLRVIALVLSVPKVVSAREPSVDRIVGQWHLMARSLNATDNVIVLAAYGVVTLRKAVHLGGRGRL